MQISVFFVLDKKKKVISESSQQSEMRNGFNLGFVSKAKPELQPEHELHRLT